MIKKSQSLSKNYKMPHLYLDDLSSLEEIFKESNPKKYKLETKDFEYQSTSELKEDNSIIHELVFRTHEPYISLSFDKNSARIYTDNDDLTTSGLISKINNKIKPTEQKGLFYIVKIIPFIGPPTFVWTLLSGIFYWKKNGEILSILLFIIAIITGFASYLSFKKDIWEYSTIELSLRKNKKNFFERNKDQLINTIISVLLGAILTYIITTLL
ncbi:MAG: hypothetical protein AAB902_00425 [Patescibacteria group bacterium]